MRHPEPVTSNSTFFESPQAAAVYKHRLLRAYVPAWAGKVGSRASGKRVFVYDAYAGPGRYDNQAPGSPELVVDTAAAMADLRSVYSIFSDKEPAYIARLNALLVEKGVDPQTYEVRQGAVETHLDAVVSTAGDAPLFVFLDPFGLTVPFDLVVQTLVGRRKGGWSAPLQPKTELLMNFSYDAVRRLAGVLRSDSDHSGRAAQIAALDRALGGAWWHEIALAEEAGWVSAVLDGFAKRVVRAAPGFAFITADVADSLTAQPIYELVLFTAHPDGLWEMANAMSFARQDWREFLVKQEEEKAQGQLVLRAMDFDDDPDAWIGEITANVRSLLQHHQAVPVRGSLGKVLGRTLGLAREMHLRAALKRLESEGVVQPCSKGSLDAKVITRV
jgi:three-Cys-motif partner protein